MADIILYDYWRSSASYRVRIALRLMGLEHKTSSINLLAAEHKTLEYLEKQPQGIVPALDVDGQTITQSLAIIEYLSQTRPEESLLPADALGMARVRAISYAIAMEIHPICNMSVVSHIEEISGGGVEVKAAWMQRFIRKGLVDVETYLSDGNSGKFCHGDMPGMADCCLIPQLFNAARWGANHDDLANICRIEQACNELPAFQKAHPDNNKPE